MYSRSAASYSSCFSTFSEKTVYSTSACRSDDGST